MFIVRECRYVCGGRKDPHVFFSRQKTTKCALGGGEGLLVRIVRGSIMTLKRGENAMIQGLNTNIAISLPTIWWSFFGFFHLCFFIEWSMAVAEEDSSLFNEDDGENCGSSGSPCCLIKNVWEKRLLSDSQLSLLSSTSSSTAIVNYFFDFFMCFVPGSTDESEESFSTSE